jgi:hypothetical protein
MHIRAHSARYICRELNVYMDTFNSQQLLSGECIYGCIGGYIRLTSVAMC